MWKGEASIEWWPICQDSPRVEKGGKSPRLKAGAAQRCKVYEDPKGVTQSAKPHSPSPSKSHDHFGMSFYLYAITYRVAILD